MQFAAFSYTNCLMLPVLLFSVIPSIFTVVKLTFANLIFRWPAICQFYDLQPKLLSLAETRGKSTNRNRKPEVEPTRHLFLSAESNTSPKSGGGPANYRSKVAKIRQLNLDEPYFKPIKNEDAFEPHAFHCKQTR